MVNNFSFRIYQYCTSLLHNKCGTECDISGIWPALKGTAEKRRPIPKTIGTTDRRNKVGYQFLRAAGSLTLTPCVGKAVRGVSCSTDYLLGLDRRETIDIAGLSEKDVAMLQALAKHLREKNRSALSEA